MSALSQDATCCCYEPRLPNGHCRIGELHSQTTVHKYVATVTNEYLLTKCSSDCEWCQTTSRLLTVFKGTLYFIFHPRSLLSDHRLFVGLTYYLQPNNTRSENKERPFRDFNYHANNLKHSLHISNKITVIYQSLYKYIDIRQTR